MVKIYDFLRYDLPQGIRNLWRYFPLIWRDRDWDYCYLLRLMEAKMRWMARNNERYCYHVGKERTVRQLRVCAELCRRVAEDDYFTTVAGELDHKMWSTPADGGMRQLHMETRKGGALVTNAQLRRWSDMGERNKKNDLTYLAMMLRRHMTGWWN